MNCNDFIIMRHSYDDHSYIDGKNDTSLTQDGIAIAKAASEHILFMLDNKEIIVRYSAKQRAKETAEIICEDLYKRGFSFKCIQDIGLTELFQGKLNFNGMEHSERVNFLQSCWEDFEENRINGNLKHKFGEKKDKMIVLSPGENHAQWSARVGGAVINILSDLKSNAQSINITHRGATFEIQKIIDMANGKILMDKVEQYETVSMKYCQDFLLHVNDIDKATERVGEFINERSLE